MDQRISDKPEFHSIESSKIRPFLEGIPPDDRLLFETYLQEAIFFWKFLFPIINERRPKSALEVGSGLGLLSLFASSQIESMTSLEPESSGFKKMSIFRDILLKSWGNRRKPTFEKFFLHELPEGRAFDFVYCINVLEHVPKPENLIREIYGRLRPGGSAWFVMPNYEFPYEQHFEIPIVLTKGITARVFRQRIRNSAVSHDPQGLWEDLSWPTHSGLAKFLRSTGWQFEFKRDVLGGYFDRLNEPLFVQRKGAIYRTFRPLIKILKPLIMVLPQRFQPVIEVIISRPQLKILKSAVS